MGRFRFFERDRGRKRFGAEWYDHEKKRRRKFFDSARARQQWANSHDQHGPLSADEAREVAQAVALCREHNVGVLRAVQAGLMSGRVTLPQSVEDALAAWLEVKARQGLSAEHIDRLKTFARRAQERWPGAEVGSIGPRLCQAWIDECQAAATAKALRAKLREWLRWCARQGWHSGKGVDELAIPREVPNEPGIITPAQLRQALDRGRGAAPVWLALGAFTGLRNRTLQLLERQHIDLEREQILLPATIMKARRRHLIEDSTLPKVDKRKPSPLWDWLAQSEAFFQCTGRTRLQNFLDARETAWPQNALRHSFATYGVALEGDAVRVSTVLAHRSPALLWSNYKGIATAEEAREWFSVRPE